MNKKAFSLFLFAALTFALTLGFYSKPQMENNYEKEWVKVDSLLNKGLTKSALEIVTVIYNKAKADNNAAQFVKAILHRMKLEAEFEEYSLEKSINKLKGEITTSKYPATPILHSILAEAYWQYYQNNRWQIYERSQTVEFKNDDISTWDINKLLDQVIKHYRASLENKDNLKNTPLNIYDDILNKEPDARKLRPSLYDFLAHRAVDFFIHEEPGITKPAYTFVLDDPGYFSLNTNFIKKGIASKDSLSLKYYAIEILQDLTELHLNDKTPEALIDVDLKRLSFVRDNSTLNNKDSLFLDALEQMEKRYLSSSSSTEISYHIADDYYQQGSKYDGRKSEEHKWDKKKAYDVCQAAIDRFPLSFGASNCKNLKDRISQKSLSFVIEEINLPNKDFRSLFSYQNINKAYVRIVRLKAEHARKQYYNQDELIRKYLDLKPAMVFNADLPDDGDYQTHHVEIKIPALDLGEYIILVSNNEKFEYGDQKLVAYRKSPISNISYVKRKTSDGGNEVYLFDRKDGSPLKSVSAQLWYSQYKYEARTYEYIKSEKYISDADGYFKIQPKEQYRNYDIEFIYNNDTLYSANDIALYRSRNENLKTTRTFFFSDRAIYRPGQTVHFKGIMISTDGKSNEILPRTSTTITFFDVNHQKISSLDLTSNEYGTFSGTFTAPQGALNGQMHIANKSGSLYFSVEDYKRPKFEVKIPPVKGSYKLGQNIKVEGFAKAYSGSNIDGAKVKYRVVRNVNFPYWWYGRGFHPSSDETEITNGETTTNDTGAFILNFIAKPDLSISKKHAPTYNFTIHTDVTDLNGETRSTQAQITVAYTALQLNLDIPEQINKTEKDHKLLVATTNMNGEHEAAQGKILIYKLKEPKTIYRNRYWEKPDKFLLSPGEYAAAFPHDVYNDEDNKFNWEKGNKVAEISFDTEKSKEFILDKIQTWDQGYYLVEATSKDKYGEEVKNIKYFTLFSGQEKKLPNITPDWFVTLKDEGEPGEKAGFLIGSSYEKVRILYEIEHANEIVKKEWLSLSNEQKLIEIPIEEKHRGNFAVHFTFIKDNRCYKHNVVINVPYTNKELDITFETFRNKLLPGQEEEWKIKIKGKKGEKVAAEMLATLYDASLDAFKSNEWNFDIYSRYYSSLQWNAVRGFSKASSSLIFRDRNIQGETRYRSYESLNWFGLYLGYGRSNLIQALKMDNKFSSRAAAIADKGMMGSEESLTADMDVKQEAPQDYQIMKDDIEKPEEDLFMVPTRKNFNETAFFYPALETNEQGEVIIKFTIPEALTKWKMMGLAHTKDLKYGLITKELITQKELMVVPNAPRFFRENDKISFTTKISNLSGKDLSGTVELSFFDAVTMKDITPLLSAAGSNKSPFSITKGLSTVLSWDLNIPEGIGAITYKVIAKANSHSDGEEMTIPVLTNKMLVTESLPLPIRGEQTKSFTFDKLISQSNGSSTLKNHKLTLEFSSNPAWYAIQALPYLMEFPYNCAEQIFSRYYANSIASHIANSSPKIKAVFDSWKNQSPDALLSNLEKNQELKSVMLEETPWILQAKDENERKKRLALLFDLNKMSNELNTALYKLQKMQVSNGAWPWFEGMPDDRYITQHIIAGMGHLDRLGIKNVREDNKTWNMITEAIRYLDNRIYQDYNYLVKHNLLDKNNLSSLQIHYLYTRSYFKDLALTKTNQKAFDYYKGQAKKHWLSNSRYMQGMIALSLHRYEDKQTSSDIIKSLKENSISSEEMGMYWKESYEGYYWHQAPIEMQALMVEVFDEVAKDQKSVDNLKVWLLKSKQTQDWKTTKATTEACYALLLKGTDWLQTEVSVDITLGNMKIEPQKMEDVKVEAGTGYFKTSWTGNEIKPEMGKVTISKPDKGVSWGALYWQYFEQLDKITPHETPLKLSKKLFLEMSTDAGPVIKPIDEKTKLSTGDKIKVRIELRVDRDMEYVHMKDMRASGLEPLNVFSGYRWQGGLGYYETTRDAATNFFFSYLPKGTYVFEYPLVVTHKGDFSNGISTIQCMYAPEFTSHSEGVRVKVNK